MKFRVGVLGGARQYANTRENVRKGRAGQSYRTDGDKGNPGGDTWYWRLLEFGTEKMGAQPIFRPVPSQAGQAAADEFVRQYSKKIDRVLRQAKKKAAKGALKSFFLTAKPLKQDTEPGSSPRTAPRLKVLRAASSTLNRMTLSPRTWWSMFERLRTLSR